MHKNSYAIDLSTRSRVVTLIDFQKSPQPSHTVAWATSVTRLDLEIFDRVLAMKPIIHVDNHENSLPYWSMKLAPLLTRAGNANHNLYRLFYVNVANHRLPWPYKTMCVDTNDDSSDRCQNECVTQMSLKAFNKFPFTHIITDNSKFKSSFDKVHMTDVDFMNSTFSAIFDKIEDRCRTKCANYNCLSSVSVTQIYDKSHDGHRWMKFRIDLPRSINYSVKHAPSMYLVDFATLVLSCFGTWLGISALDFNPLKLIGHVQSGLYRNRKLTPDQRKIQKLESDMVAIWLIVTRQRRN